METLIFAKTQAKQYVNKDNPPITPKITPIVFITAHNTVDTLFNFNSFQSFT